MARTRRSIALEESAAKRAKTEESSEQKNGAFEVGDPIPDVEVTLQSEETVDLATKFNSGILVLFAYPKASTPGCTRQTSGFGKSYSEFQKLGAAVYGLSADSPKAQTTFKEKTGVAFDLISDPQYELLGPLGAKKSPKGVIRSHWVFVDGKAVLVEHAVKPDSSPEITLEKVKEFAKSSNGEEKSEEPENSTEISTKPAETEAESESKPDTETETQAETRQTEEEPSNSNGTVLNNEGASAEPSAEPSADHEAAPSKASEPESNVVDQPEDESKENGAADTTEDPTKAESA